jgi:Uma2 family endonuclease
MSMAATGHIPLREYLETTYRPDREYVDGEIRERNVGKYEHARIQAVLAGQLGAHEQEWGIVGCVAPRVRVAENRVRVPDLVALTAGPQPDVIVEPPILLIEILSPDDGYSDTQERARDYQKMGVGTV